MSPQTAVKIRFPSGFSEITYSQEVPEVGDRLRRGDNEWKVIAVEQEEEDGKSLVRLSPGTPPEDGRRTAALQSQAAQ